MIEKLTGGELERTLLARDPKKYIFKLYELRNVGDPRLAVTGRYGYKIGNDIVIVSLYWFGGCHIYFEVSDTDNLRKIYDAVFDEMSGGKEYVLSSDDEKLFSESKFVSLFGKHDISHYEQYGMFSTPKKREYKYAVRQLTENDEAAVLVFEEPHTDFRDNLRNAYETRVKTGGVNCRVYGCFDGAGAILGYLITDTFDGDFWDISYVYTSEHMRGQGIATELASFYACDICGEGKFASYGTPENESSKHAAIKAGFEMFESEYKTSWTPTEGLKIISAG